MKKTLLLLLLSPLFVVAQKNSIASETIAKTIQGDNYHFSKVPFKVQSGHGESITVLFTANISKSFWKQYVVKKGNNEKKAFSQIVWMFSFDAKNSLNNRLSFVPLKNQFFSDDNGSFVSIYKMMGRNGYGNLIETDALVTYSPFETEASALAITDTSSINLRMPKLDFKIAEKDTRPGLNVSGIKF